jgi:hypothetical protein
MIYSLFIEDRGGEPWSGTVWRRRGDYPTLEAAEEAAANFRRDWIHSWPRHVIVRFPSPDPGVEGEVVKRYGF